MNTKLKNLTQKDSFWALIFLTPAALGTLIFIILPVFASFGLSFCKWDLLSPIKFTGLNNYIELFHDEIFYKVLLNTFVYAFFTAIFSIIIPLLLAIILNKKIKGANAFKTAYFLPYITPMIVIAIVWSWIFDPNFGIMNWFLMTGNNIKWLYDKNTAMLALIIVSVWKNIGYNMVIFSAGLTAIPDSIDEASQIEGAEGFKKFFFVTLPMLSPTVFFVLVITTISSFQVFDLIYLMTEGGPENSTSVMVYWVYKQAFEFFNAGKASAVAYVLFIIILVFTYIQWITRKKWVINE